MIDYFLRVAALLWPHALLIVATSWLGGRSRTLFLSTLIGITAALVAALIYWLIQNGIAPDHEPLVSGQLVALIIAGALPLLAASISSYVSHNRGASAKSSALIGVAVGLLLLVPMPTLQLRLGCMFTGICP